MSEPKEMPQPKKKNTVDYKTAMQWFEDWAEAMDIDTDTSDMDEDDQRDFEKIKKRIIKTIEKGALAFNEDNEAVFTPTHSRSKYKEAITIRERTGASIMAMDGKKKNQDVRKMYAVLADMSGLHQSVFAGLVGPDVKLCENIFVLLMQ